MVMKRFAAPRYSGLLAILVYFLISIIVPMGLHGGDKKSILDYYYIMPEDYLSIEPDLDSRKFRKKIIEINSVRTGYLKVRVPEIFGWYELGIFRDKKRVRDIIFLNTVGCGPGCQTVNFKILTYNKISKDFVDVKDEIFPQLSPDITDRGFVLEVPRYGTTLHIFRAGREGVGKKLPYRIYWRKGRFVLEKNKRSHQE